MAHWKSRNSGRPSSAFAAIAILLLAACQQGPGPNIEQPERSWRVIESLGDARIESDHALHINNLHPGDEIGGDKRIVTGRSAHLIMSQGDVQFTANGKASIHLPDNQSPTSLAPSFGTVRVRLAAAADAVKRITTPHLIASGTIAVLDLTVDERETTIKVESGHVALSTSDGQRHARLAAGASARLGAKSDGRLELRAADQMPFKPIATLVAKPQEKLIATPQEKMALVPKSEAKNKATIRKATMPDRQSVKPAKAAILPASRLKVPPPSPPKAPADRVVAPNRPMLQQANSNEPLSPRVDRAARPPLRRDRFDRLTEGLLDNLPTAKALAYQGL